MKLTIHQGTHQIGGCITEIQHEGYRLFIDMGKPLPGTSDAEPLEVEGLTHGDTTHSALFITHYHDDHIGEILEAKSDVPVYMGKTSLEIYRRGKGYLYNVLQPHGVEHVEAILKRIETVRTFLPGECLQIGPFQITPLMIDHSAFDAYMFVIEAGGTRLLYTGDFRGHGFRSKALPKLLAVYAKNIDYVISEGTNIYRSANIESEPSLQHRFIKEFHQSKYNFVLTASTNMDRIFSLYHAAYQAGRIFVCDNYQKQLMDIVASNHGVYTNFYKIREQIFVPKRYKDGNIFCPERLLELMKRKGFCMLIRSNPHFWNFVAKFDGDQDQAIYYSMWEGYLDESSPATLNRSMKEALARYPDFKSMHTSGHCDIRTLEKLFWQVKPKKGIIPIHTEHPERFETLFGQIAPVILLEDGNTYDCC